MNNPHLDKEFEILLLNDYPWLLDHSVQQFQDTTHKVKPGPHQRLSHIYQPHEDEDNTPKASDEDFDEEEELQLTSPKLT